jgi:heme exporter protein C
LRRSTSCSSRRAWPRSPTRSRNDAPLSASGTQLRRNKVRRDAPPRRLARHRCAPCRRRRLHSRDLVHAGRDATGFLAFGLVAVAGLLYLWLRDERLDRFAESSAEVGVVFTTVVLVTGPLWGKPVWGTWWTWDARLTSTLFLWFIYVGYLVLRGAIDSPTLRARYSAILGALGALLIPFIHLSVYLFRTLHPRPIILKPDRPSLPAEMLTTMLFALAAFTLLYVALVRGRYRLARERDQANAEADA